MPSVFLNSDTSQTATIRALVLPHPKVSVQFRPPNGYSGAFGFDWVRMGDTSATTGDTWYRDIIGSDASGAFVKDAAKYRALLRKYQQEDHPTRDNDKYIVPVATLMKDKSAKFTLKLDVAIEPNELTIDYNEEFFTINESEISSKEVGKRSLVDFLEVECIEEFSEDQDINILADGKFAGRLKFLANDRAHRSYKKIELVKVKTDLNNSGVVNVPSVTGQKGVIRKFLRQPLCTAGIWTKELDLSSNVEMRTTHRLTHNGTFKVKKTTAALSDFLEAQFDAAFPDDTENFKIFLFDEDGGRFKTDGSFVGLAGFAPIGGKKVVMFKDPIKTDIVHELFHSMGLFHSFSDSGQFTFEKNKTDNMMDYSDTATPPITLKSTWRWQWKKLNRRIST